MDPKYVFGVEWFDEPAKLIRYYNLMYYINSKQIEIFDLKTKKMFLKKTLIPSVQLKDLFITSIVTIYSRQFKIASYGDQFTKQALDMDSNRTFAMIKPNAYMNMGKIINNIESTFRIANLKMTQLTREQAEEFYAEHKGKFFYDDLIKMITSDYVVGMELSCPDAINTWRTALGPTDVQKARQEAPNSIRALYGDANGNAAHGSDSVTSFHRELNIFFGKSVRSNPQYSNNTCCVIKPHAVNENKVGLIIDTILHQGFEISAAQVFYLNKRSAQEFFEVYDGVLPEFQQMVSELSSGKCVALEVRQENVVERFRELCGPHDPEVCTLVKPKSIRAQLGRSKVENAVHCTDLKQDATLEVEYFFNVLQN